MELQIQDLVSSIRRDGVEAANKEAAAIIDEAQKKAETIIAAAEADAKARRDALEKEIDMLKESASVSAQQAKRDALLAFKTEVQAQFESILAADVRKALSEEALVKLVRAALAGEDVSQYAVELASVGDTIKAELAEEIRKGLEIRPVKNVQAGFRLAAKDGSGYFDCSDEEITKMLMPYFRNLSF